ncbi:hypothetical protein COU76_00195 [Candidatus Peregrinibacteria bacterium CG10_big_fil_rev_8_21_14_0_10_49_10]|nr:MAG: hypothetical protein COU76_00195 [Candidatus Peregrinibacteria bacterium CG10_big_fil_rev_8_21_14_0_10_49_10]
MKHWFFGPIISARIQFFRYVFVGGSSAVVNLVAYGVLTEALHLHYLFAAFLGYVLGFLWNYITSVLWVFTSRHPRHKEALLLIGITVGGLLWTEIILYLFVEYVHLHHFLAMILTLWIVLFWNFGMRKRFVFH